MTAALALPAASLALDAAGKLIRANMDAPTQRRLVDEFLADVPAGDSATTTGRN